MAVGLLTIRFISDGSASMGALVVTSGGKSGATMVCWVVSSVLLPNTFVPMSITSPPTCVTPPTIAPMTKLPAASFIIFRFVSKTLLTESSTNADSATSCPPSLVPRITAFLTRFLPAPGRKASTDPTVETLSMLSRKISEATKAFALSLAIAIILKSVFASSPP